MRNSPWSAGMVALMLLGCESKPGSSPLAMKESPVFDGAFGDPKILGASTLQVSDPSTTLVGFIPLKSPDGRYTAWVLKDQTAGAETCAFVDDATSGKRVRMVCPSLKAGPVEEATWLSSEKLLGVQRRAELPEYGLERASGVSYRVRALVDLPSGKFIYVLPSILKAS